MHPCHISFSALVWTGKQAQLTVKSHCGVFIGNSMVTDLVVDNDTVILAESLEILVMVFETPHEQTTLLELKVSWAKTGIWRLTG